MTLLKQSGLLTATGLKLPPIESFVNSANHPFHPEASPASIADWWPETDFDWSVSRNPDGSSTLALKAFAFRYRAATGEARFFTNFTFNIDYAPSPVEITRLSLDKTVYPAGAPVRADLHLRSSSQAPLDVVAEARIFENEDTLVAQLPTRSLHGWLPSPRGIGWCLFAQFGGQTTALGVGADWTDTPLYWATITSQPDGVRLEWFSGTGRHYDLDFTPALGAIPLSCMASNLPATTPRNTYQFTPKDSHGFYRLRELR